MSFTFVQLFTLLTLNCGPILQLGSIVLISILDSNILENRRQHAKIHSQLIVFFHSLLCAGNKILFPWNQQTNSSYHPASGCNTINTIRRKKTLVHCALRLHSADNHLLAASVGEKKKRRNSNFIQGRVEIWAVNVAHNAERSTSRLNENEWKQMEITGCWKRVAL